MNLDKIIFIYYFNNNLRSSIWALLDKKDYNLDNWDVVVEKAINVKAKSNY